MTAANSRDLRCVACGAPNGHPLPVADHHRILGDTTDNRPSNKIALCGTGNVPPGCHGQAHSRRKAFGDPLGYIVTRHQDREVTLRVPVYFSQPDLGRTGWDLLDDDWGLTPCDAHGTPSPDHCHT